MELEGGRMDTYLVEHSYTQKKRVCKAANGHIKSKMLQIEEHVYPGFFVSRAREKAYFCAATCSEARPLYKIFTFFEAGKKLQGAQRGNAFSYENFVGLTLLTTELLMRILNNQIKFLTPKSVCRLCPSTKYLRLRDCFEIDPVC